MSENKEIINSWSLVAFKSIHGKMYVGEFINKKTGEPFKSPVFQDKEGKRTYVSFSSKLGEMTPKDISARKAELGVVQFPDTIDEVSGDTIHHYCLCRRGEVPSSWEEVDI